MNLPLFLPEDISNSLAAVMGGWKKPLYPPPGVLIPQKRNELGLGSRALTRGHVVEWASQSGSGGLVWRRPLPLPFSGPGLGVQPPLVS